MITFQAELESFKSRKDKTYLVNLGTQELEDDTVGTLNHNLNEQVTVILVPDGDPAMKKIIQALKEINEEENK